MEEKRQTANATGAYYGLLTGIGLVIFNLLLYILNLQTSVYVGYFNYLIIIAAVWFAATSHRDKYQDGVISYGKSLAVGVLTMVYASFILAIYMYIYYKFIDPEAVGRLLIEAEEALYNMGYNEDFIEQSMEMQKVFMGPGYLAFGVFFSTVIQGTIISLIVSIFTKRDQKNTDL